jgi:hypothetical protein
MLHTSVTAVLAEATQNSTPDPVALGLLAGGILVALLIIVTRFNKDR